MNKTHIPALVKRYQEARKTGAYPYFDADEIDEMLEWFAEKDMHEDYEDLLKLGLSQHPENTLLHKRQCRYYIYKFQYEKALELLDNIQNDEDAEIEMMRLECYYELDNIDAILKRIEILSETQYKYLEDLLEYIVPMLNDKDMMDASAKIIRKGLSRFPANTLLMDELGYMYELGGHLKKAIKISNRLLDADPHSYDHWFNLGRLHAFNSNYPDAIEAFEFALACADSKEDETDYELNVLLAYCFFMNDNYEKALEKYTSLSEDNNPRVYVHVRTMMSECYAKLDNVEQAFQILQELIKENDDDIHICMKYVLYAIETNRRKEALTILTSILMLLPQKLYASAEDLIGFIIKGRTNQAINLADDIISHIEERNAEEYYYDDATTLLMNCSRTWDYDFYPQNQPAAKLIDAYLKKSMNKN